MSRVAVGEQQFVGGTVDVRMLVARVVSPSIDVPLDRRAVPDREAPDVAVDQPVALEVLVVHRKRVGPTLAEHRPRRPRDLEPRLEVRERVLLEARCLTTVDQHERDGSDAVCVGRPDADVETEPRLELELVAVDGLDRRRAP